MKEAIRGDKDALVKLIMNKKDDYYRLAYVYMKNKEDSLDMLQDMIVILYKNIGSLKKKDSFYSWSKQILVNLCKTELGKRNKNIVMEELPEVRHEDNKYKNVEDKMYLKSLIDNLNEDQKEAIKLRYYLDYSYDDIALITNVPLGTVKSRIGKGIGRLRKILGGEKYEGI